MTTEARRQLLQRIHERTDVLLERTASTIQEALQLYLDGVEERRRQQREDEPRS